MVSKYLTKKDFKSNEYAFAYGVVKFVMDMHSENWFLPKDMAPKSGIIPEISAAIAFLAGYRFSYYEDVFNVLFHFFPRTLDGFRIAMSHLSVIFHGSYYTNSRFLFYCTELSVYALLMFKEGFRDAPYISVLMLYNYLWHIKNSSSLVDSVCYFTWNQLGDFCRELSKDNKENPFIAFENVLGRMDTLF